MATKRSADSENDQQRNVTKKSRTKSSNLKLPPALERLERLFPEINTFCAFCDARLTTAVTLDRIRSAVPDARLADLAAINVIMPDFIHFEHQNANMIIQFGKPVSKRIAREKQTSAMRNRGDEWAMRKPAPKPLKPEMIKRTIDQRNKKFIKSLKDFFSRCLKEVSEFLQAFRLICSVRAWDWRESCYRKSIHPNIWHRRSSRTCPQNLRHLLHHHHQQQQQQQQEDHKIYPVMKSYPQILTLNRHLSLTFLNDCVSNPFIADSWILKVASANSLKSMLNMVKDRTRRLRNAIANLSIIYTAWWKGTLDPPLPQEIQAALEQKGIHELYTHQTIAIQSLREKKHVIVATSTARYEIKIQVLISITQHKYQWQIIDLSAARSRKSIDGRYKQSHVYFSDKSLGAGSNEGYEGTCTTMPQPVRYTGMPCMITTAALNDPLITFKDVDFWWRYSKRRSSWDQSQRQRDIYKSRYASSCHITKLQELEIFSRCIALRGCRW